MSRTSPCRRSGGCYGGDRSRKEILVDYGFRLPSALDNRPLTFDEFMAHIRQGIYVSATPGPFEMQNSPTDRGASYPPDRADRPGDQRTPDRWPDRRCPDRDARADQEGPACPDDHADETDGPRI